MSRLTRSASTKSSLASSKVTKKQHQKKKIPEVTPLKIVTSLDPSKTTYDEFYDIVMKHKNEANPYGRTVMKQCSAFINKKLLSEGFIRPTREDLKDLCKPLKLCMVLFGATLENQLTSLGNIHLKFPTQQNLQRKLFEWYASSIQIEREHSGIYSALHSPQSIRVPWTVNEIEYIAIKTSTADINDVIYASNTVFSDWSGGYQCECIISMILLLASLLANRDHDPDSDGYKPRWYFDVADLDIFDLDRFEGSTIFFDKVFFMLQLLVSMVEQQEDFVSIRKLSLESVYYDKKCLDIIYKLSACGSKLIEFNDYSNVQEKDLLEYEARLMRQKLYCRIGESKAVFVTAKYKTISDLNDLFAPL